MKRCFFAAFPGEQVRAALAAEALRRAASEGGRAVRAANLHLTLAFVGSLPDERLDALTAVGAGVRAASFDLLLDRSGRFDRAGVAWIAPTVVPAALLDLQRRLADGCRDAGFPLEARAYRPHVTLLRDDAGRAGSGARGRGARADRSVHPALQGVRAAPAPGPAAASAPIPPPAPIAWPVRDFVLVVSQPAPGGSIYTPVAGWPLR